MAKARMLHKKISVSQQVNKLSVPAKLLFSWLIAHVDDEGRSHGEADYIKATVVPMTKWSFKRIETYLHEIKNVGLIYRWEQNNEWFIEFVKWRDHQQIRADRYKPSYLPSFLKVKDTLLPTKKPPNGNQVTLQSNVIKSNVIEVNPGRNIQNNSSSQERTSSGASQRIRDTLLKKGIPIKK